MTSLKQQKLWARHDALMKRWDAIEEEVGAVFEKTHPWLFNGGKPELIETEETIRLEDKNNHARTEVIAAIEKINEELFPKKNVTFIQTEFV